jgi:hypothetical protein
LLINVLFMVDICIPINPQLDTRLRGTFISVKINNIVYRAD